MRTRSLLLSACLIFSAAFALDAPDVQISCTIDFDSTYTQLSWVPYRWREQLPHLWTNYI